jgi:ATP-dependent Lon protease
LIVAQRDPAVDAPKSADLYATGTVASILKVFTLPDGTKSILVQGGDRARVLSVLQEEPAMKVIAYRVTDEIVPDAEQDGFVSAMKRVFLQISELSDELTAEHANLVRNLEEPGAVADIATSLVSAQVEEKQEILETQNVMERLRKAHTLLSKAFNRLEIGDKIRNEVQEEVNKTQREFFLREQLKAITKELGESNENEETREFKARLAKASLPDDVRKTADKEVERLAKIHPSSAEYIVSRTYLEWILDLPWQISTPDRLDIAAANEILEHDHFGLGKAKKRILEYLAVRKLKNDMRGPILCFVGPPGVGKTSLGRSIANALGRKFIRLSLGGVSDEAEIRGHRRTYIGALPGRIIQGIKKAGSNNPVFMLDEIDKLGRDFRGDPSSALLEVLDPEQNSTFSDHYIELPFDLSNVLFIATANMLDTIPSPLRDRMEIVEIPSYVVEEKVEIAKGFLVPKQLAAHGLTAEQVRFEDAAVSAIIRDYTREAGVRSLERRIADVCRGIAKNIVEEKDRSVLVTADGLTPYLGRQAFFSEIIERINRPGIATGLAWTPVGGDILFIEAAKIKGKGALTLTGQLGDVMKESAQAALSYIASQAEHLGVDESFRERFDIHIHFPAGAVPKDGPSAGVTILTAVVSVLTGRVVRNDLAMTGEITLRGAVLPVGGIREKILAAHRAGVRTVILPERNQRDLEDVPAHVVKEMRFHFVKEMEDVLRFAFAESEAVEVPEAAAVA